MDVFSKSDLLATNVYHIDCTYTKLSLSAQMLKLLFTGSVNRALSRQPQLICSLFVRAFIKPSLTSFCLFVFVLDGADLYVDHSLWFFGLFRVGFFGWVGGFF